MEIPIISPADFGLDASKIGASGAKIQIESMVMPPEGEGAEMISGTAEDAAGKLAQILKEKGGIL